MRFLHSRAVICLLLLVPALPFLFPRRRGLNFNALHSREHHFNTGFLQSQRRELLISYFTLKATRCDEYANQFRTIEAERNPLWRKINVVAAYLNSVIVGLICVIIMKTLNKFTVYRLPVLLDLVFERETDRGLLTVSNHQSVLDDPGIWGAMIPFWRLKPSQLRWVLCTEDVFFAVRSM